MSKKYDNSPFFLSVLDLERGPGNSKDFRHSLILDEKFDDGMQGVNAGTEVDYSITMESVIEGIYVIGNLTTKVFKTCAKCAKITEEEVELPLNAFYIYGNKVCEDDIDTEDDTYNLIDDHYIDLVQLLRDTVFESFDFTPLCSEDCQGLPNVYGGENNDSDNENDNFDPRFQALKDLLS